jgi:hypothetical protein
MDKNLEEFSDAEKKLIETGQMTAEEIREVKSFDPSQGSALKHYTGIFQKPQIDEKALQRNRMLGAIGDSMKLLGQMYGVHNGVRIERNDPDKTLTTYFAGKEDEARNLYQKNLDDLNRGYYNALINDYQLKNNYLLKLRDKMAHDLKYQQEWDRNEDRYTKEKETEAKIYAEQKEQQEKVFKETIRSNKAREGIARGQSNSKDNKESDFIYIKPRLGDANPGIKTHPDLGRIISIQLTGKEIDSYAKMALADKDFVANHPKLFKTVTEKGYGGVETLRETLESAVDAKQIATTYLQEEYDGWLPNAPAQTKPAQSENPAFQWQNGWPTAGGTAGGGRLTEMQLPQKHIEEMQRIVQENPNNEAAAIDSIMSFLKGEAYSVEEASHILNLIYTK